MQYLVELVAPTEDLCSRDGLTSNIINTIQSDRCYNLGGDKVTTEHGAGSDFSFFLEEGKGRGVYQNMASFNR